MKWIWRDSLPAFARAPLPPPCPGVILFRPPVAIETNSPDAIRRTADLLALDRASVESALSRPSRALGQASGSEIALIAIGRLARNDPAAAAQRLQEIETLRAMGTIS